MEIKQIKEFANSSIIQMRIYVYMNMKYIVSDLFMCIVFPTQNPHVSIFRSQKIHKSIHKKIDVIKWIKTNELFFCFCLFVSLFFVQQTHNLLCTGQTKFLPHVFEFPYVLSAVLQSSDAAMDLVPNTQSVVLIFGALLLILNPTLRLSWDLTGIHWWSVTIWSTISLAQNFATHLSNLGIYKLL